MMQCALAVLCNSHAAIDNSALLPRLPRQAAAAEPHLAVPPAGLPVAEAPSRRHPRMRHVRCTAARLSILPGHCTRPVCSPSRHTALPRPGVSASACIRLFTLLLSCCKPAGGLQQLLSLPSVPTTLASMGAADEPACIANNKTGEGMQMQGFARRSLCRATAAPRVSLRCSASPLVPFAGPCDFSAAQLQLAKAPGRAGTPPPACRRCTPASCLACAVCRSPTPALSLPTPQARSGRCVVHWELLVGGGIGGSPHDGSPPALCLPAPRSARPSKATAACALRPLPAGRRPHLL